MTDKQIPIDEQMENLNNLATQQLKRIEEEKRQIEHIAKTHLVETFDMQREIDKLKKELQAKEQECEELKEEIKKHNDDMFKNPPEKRFYCKGCTLPYISKKFKATLTEIKEIAITGLEGFCPKCSRKECEDNNCIETAIRDILQKISECEGNDE